MSIKTLFSSLCLALMLSLSLPAVSLLTPPVQAQVAGPRASITYASKGSSFLVVMSGVQSVNYTIEYTRAVGNGEMLEGIQSAGKGKKGAYAKRHYAGTQSSKYFIPHKVKSGTLMVKGKDLKGKAFSKTIKFTVSSKGVLKVISST
ncbi:MAG TPA: hypothetical protein VD999_07065 [Vitreimonas sp.]|nr:hypothetical protein [Vitreimonas sp.]